LRAEALLLAISLQAAPAGAQDLSIGRLEHYTDNRGWNEAGLGPTWQTVVEAVVAPAGFPTLVFAEQNGVREPLALFPPDVYVLWKRADPAFAGRWRISAERGDARAAAQAPAIAKPQQVPLAASVRVIGKGAAPRLAWKLPGLAGFDVDRIRVGVRGGEKIQGRFLSLLWVSDALPVTATRFAIPAGVLKRGERYVFQVMLEDLEEGRLENRSLAFSDPYRVP
jgi:hypothetical protein